MKVQAKDKDDRIHFLEDRLKTAEIKLGSAGRTVPSNPDGATPKEEEETGRSLSGKGSVTEEDPLIPAVPPIRDDLYPFNPRRRFFSRKREKETELFIRQFMENEDYSNEQKDFLIRCLEQGDSVEFIKEFASPKLSVEHMAWLRKIVGGRMRYGR